MAFAPWCYLLLLCRCLQRLHAGGPWPKVNPDTWPVWQPPPGFAAEFDSWPDPGVGNLPEEVRVWCKGFIPKNVSSAVVEGQNVLPIELPGGFPVPGYRGQCAVIDGRDWTEVPYDGDRPGDARFAARLSVRLEIGNSSVEGITKCGYSHNVCCDPKGCGAAPYGAYTCGPLHCPDEDMQVRRMRCWTDTGVSGAGWSTEGEDCAGAKDFQNHLAVKAYFYGRGGDPCVSPLGVPSPPATWDIGVVIFPTKRRVWLTGFVDDAPSTECYAQAKDDGIWGQPVPAVQLPCAPGNLVENIIGYSDRPVNPSGGMIVLPRPSTLVV